jgi:hypothetical protein
MAYSPADEGVLVLRTYDHQNADHFCEKLVLAYGLCVSMNIISDHVICVSDFWELDSRLNELK